MADPGVDGRGTKGVSRGLAPPATFKVSNTVADPGIDRRGRERGVWGACCEKFLQQIASRV